MTGYLHHPASFKDPAGFVFQFNKSYYRHINQAYAEHYDLLLNSGLYRALTEQKLLIPHTEIPENITGIEDWYKTLLPLQLPFISYAYEWSFDQLKDAALLTLTIMRIAMEHGMVLKDATSFNVQFHEGRPVFIDTLSFEKYNPSVPWVAYKQFCECFLFPLYLSHYLKTDLQKILSINLDGIPVETTARLLPVKSSLNMGVWLHVHLQNRIKDDKDKEGDQGNFDKKKLGYLLKHLESIITHFKVSHTQNSTWSNYYRETIMSQDYLAKKEALIRSFIEGLHFNTALDAGANDGYFSRILAERKTHVIAIDSDNQCINNLYVFIKKNKLTHILPLCFDITNPTPAVGFMNMERKSFLQRNETDMVLALALIHHLVLGKNIQLGKVAEYMSILTQKYLVIEFVPVTDPKALELVKNKIVYHRYDVMEFEDYFQRHFAIEKKQAIPGTERILYQMKKNSQPTPP